LGQKEEKKGEMNRERSARNQGEKTKHFGLQRKGGNKVNSTSFGREKKS